MGAFYASMCQNTLVDSVIYSNVSHWFRDWSAIRICIRMHAFTYNINEFTYNINEFINKLTPTAAH